VIKLIRALFLIKLAISPEYTLCTAAIFADPIFDTTDPRVAGNKPKEDSVAVNNLPLEDTNQRILAHIADQDEPDGAATKEIKITVPRLPFTRSEADSITALAGRGSLKALGFQASKAVVFNQDLQQYRYLHFATHGYLDSERPELSALLLSLYDEEGNQQDGILKTGDIFNLDLPMEMVVLSACETGLGQHLFGEGVVGMTRAFLYAGAQRVTVSLWSVNDRATAQLMTRMYQAILRDKRRPAAALRAAQLKLWRSKKWQQPFYWAAFVIQGEWR
jgi:CHAT domain-containing protein